MFSTVQYLMHPIQVCTLILLCAGTALYVVGEDEEEEELTALAQEEMEDVLGRIDKSGEGVCVQASTLGSLEALLDFLKTPEVSIWFLDMFVSLSLTVLIVIMDSLLAKRVV